MINSGEKSTVDALYELTKKEMDLKERAIKCLYAHSRISILENNENILFIGSSGTGKTHLATSIGIKA